MTKTPNEGDVRWLGNPCKCGALACRGSLDEQIRGFVEPNKQEYLLDQIQDALSKARREERAKFRALIPCGREEDEWLERCNLNELCPNCEDILYLCNREGSAGKGEEPKERHWHCAYHDRIVKAGAYLTCCCHHPNVDCSDDQARRSESEKDPTSEVNGIMDTKTVMRFENHKLSEDRQRRVEEITNELHSKLNLSERRTTSEAIVKAVLDLQKL